MAPENERMSRKKGPFPKMDHLPSTVFQWTCYISGEYPKLESCPIKVLGN